MGFDEDHFSSEELGEEEEPLYRMNMPMALCVYGLLFSLSKDVEAIERKELPASIRAKWNTGRDVAEHLRADLREWLAAEMGDAELDRMETQLRADARKLGLNL